MMEHERITLAVTGGSGFIGRGIVENCAAAGVRCRILSRSSRPDWAPTEIDWAIIPAYDDVAALRGALTGVRYVLHLADNPDRGEARSADTAIRACDALIDAIRGSGVEGLIFASSVYARSAKEGAASYGAVKRAMEDRFRAAPDIRTVILRLPPVYGPGGRGGLTMLARLVGKNVPLPLGSAKASRAYLSRDNLASLIRTMIEADSGRWTAAGQVFEPSDGRAVATRDLIRMMGLALGRKPLLIPVPIGLLRVLGGITRRSEMIGGAVDPLEVAPAADLEQAFGWRAAEQMPESLSFLARGN